MLKVEDTAIVLIDLQGKLARMVHESETLLDQMTKLVKGAKVLGVPIIWMEQYPQGLGSTLNPVRELLEATNTPISKMVFSACSNEAFQEAERKIEAKNYLVAGIEAHICVYQTVQGLLQQGRYTEIVTDAISSRTLENKEVAIQKMTSLGAEVTSVEMALFELMGTAEHPQFKTVSQIIK